MSHIGTSVDLEYQGKTLHVSLLQNPSHLEAVNPVALGKVNLFVCFLFVVCFLSCWYSFLCFVTIFLYSFLCFSTIRLCSFLLLFLFGLFCDFFLFEKKRREQNKH
jgi:hypothetical protein